MPLWFNGENDKKLTPFFIFFIGAEEGFIVFGIWEWELNTQDNCFPVNGEEKK